MKRVRVIFWLVVVMTALAFASLSLDFNGRDFNRNPDSSDLVITFKTQQGKDSYGNGVRGHSADYWYWHYGIRSRFKNHGLSVCVGIIAPIVVILLALLFEPAIVRRIRNVTGET